MLDEDYTCSRPRRWRGYWKEGCIFFGVVTGVLLIILIAVASYRKLETSDVGQTFDCDTSQEHINLNIPELPPVFADLTEYELNNISRYLFAQKDINLISVNHAQVTSSYLYSVELLLPEKAAVLRYLDQGGQRPERWAKAIIFHGDTIPPEISEYRVGPLPDPIGHYLIEYGGQRKNPIHFAYRPLTFTDVQLINYFIFPKILNKTEPMFAKAYGATFNECGKRCLSYSIGPVSSSNFGKVVRKFWLRLNYQVEFMTLHPLDFQVLVNLDGINTSKYHIEKVWFNQKVFNNLQDAVNTYKEENKPQLKFPHVDNNLFSTLHLRGKPFPEIPLRRPYQVEPDGKRYSVNGQHVEYMAWSFEYRMSTSTGPMLFDVRFRKQRIAYEISLQEIAVFYSGYAPASRFSDIVDSASMIGILSKVLVPGSDCPDHATFLPARHLTDDSDAPLVFQNALCLFEQNTGNPLRRHHSFNGYTGNFYEGLMDDILVLRTILTVGNYDYIFDYVFHQNGVIEVKVMATGYILASFYSTNEDKFGFQIHKNLLGNIHQHMFNFKVDIDIFGRSNRFESLDLSVDQTPNKDWSDVPSAEEYNQMMFQRHLRKTELDAAYMFDFNKPKYLLFYNNNQKTDEGLSRAYRIAINGVSKQLLPKGKGHEPSISWARYQMAVTKFKQSELQSSSIYAIWDAVDPVNYFQSFLDDDENIVDEDLVAWVSMGVHHIPHTEDLPVTPTVGGHLQFFIQPYNYFNEDPSVASRNAIRYDLSGTNKKLRVYRYGMEKRDKCFPRTTNFDETVKKDSKILFV